MKKNKRILFARQIKTLDQSTLPAMAKISQNNFVFLRQFYEPSGFSAG
ncbi:hypothetical protein NF867_16900 [Solitalea sp. MAHUQ-68]|uniref:Uncharacterized protein n=1 Tax=Solitalea agri TaxID=2953739 RepID=A0A9X2F5H9_9SPHI|nr:hypothetical protein [Solitalea agri]MCO4294544.1 hypothetical protein [Solitalea agri]